MAKRLVVVFWLCLVFIFSMAAPSLVRAACEGYCAERTLSGCAYNGCTVHRDSQDKVTCVQCYYAGTNDEGIVCLGVTEIGNCGDSGGKGPGPILE
jgi:hypothetical protein